MTRASNGQLQVSPCEGGFPRHHVNSENVETYAIWPYGFFAVNRSGDEAKNFPLSIGKNTFENVHFGHGNSAWRYDGQDAAMLGQAEWAWKFLVSRVTDQGHCEGSRFRGYLVGARNSGCRVEWSV